MHTSAYRPPLYYMLISLCAASVAVEILYSNGRLQTLLLLLKIMLIALSLRAGVFYEYPGFYGTDTWGHITTIEEWIKDGHISTYLPTLAKPVVYANMPVMYLNDIATRIVTSLNPKDSLFVSVGLLNIVSILFIYLLAQRLLGKKGALLAALIVSVERFHIVYGVFLIPNVLGLTIYCMIFYLILGKNRSTSNIVLIFLLFLAMVFTHSAASFITLVTLAFLLIANEIGKKLDRINKSDVNITFSMVGVFGVMMFSHWNFMFYKEEYTRLTSYLQQFYFSAVTTGPELVGLDSPTPTTSNRMEFLILVGFIMLGCLLWLSPKLRNNLRVNIIAATFMISSMTFLLPVFDIPNLAPSRWLPFILVIGVGLLVQGMLGLSAIGKSSIARVILMAIIVFTFSMVSINNNAVNTHSPFVEAPIRLQYTQSEQSAIDTILENYENKIVGDSPFMSEYFGFKNKFREGGRLEDLPEIEGTNIIVVRKYVYTHLELLKESGSDKLAGLDSSQYNLIYRNHEVKAYLPR
ncbi:glycosyltransferase family 39 protein [Chloroflexota bacterium]